MIGTGSYHSRKLSQPELIGTGSDGKRKWPEVNWTGSDLTGSDLNRKWVISGHGHFRSRSFPVTVIYGSDHFRFRSFPVPITSGFDRFRFRSLPVQVTSGSDCDNFRFRSFPVTFISGSDQFRFRPFPVQITSDSRIFFRPGHFTKTSLAPPQSDARAFLRVCLFATNAKNAPWTDWRVNGTTNDVRTCRLFQICLKCHIHLNTN